MGEGGTGRAAAGIVRFAWVPCALLLAAALAYLVAKSLLSHDPESDFRFLWTAGHLWATGVDPYGDAFTAEGRRLFPDGNAIAYWLYPPQWWLICRPLAALPVEAALRSWRVVNAALLIGGGLVLIRAARRGGVAVPRWAALLFLALLALAEGTPQTLAMGQTSILICTGFCLVAAALLAGGQVAMAGGLVLLCLKPQFGAAAVIPLLLWPRWWPAIAAALGLSLLAALPQLAMHGLQPTIAGFLHNLARHGELAPNQPIKLTGLTQLAIRLAGLRLTTAVTVGLAALAGAGAVILWRRTGAPQAAAGIAVALVATAMLILPLHSYDFVALTPVALLVLPFGRTARAATWAGVIVAARAGLLAAAFGSRGAGDILLLTLAALLVAAGAVLAFRDATRAP